MREFFDASELVAALWRGHPSHYAPSPRFVSTSSMTALPVKETILPAQALFFVDEVRARFTQWAWIAKNTIERLPMRQSEISTAEGFTIAFCWGVP